MDRRTSSSTAHLGFQVRDGARRTGLGAVVGDRLNEASIPETLGVVGRGDLHPIIVCDSTDRPDDNTEQTDKEYQ